jgi:DNA invertase Pin-like site-specific DNA recombinase
MFQDASQRRFDVLLFWTLDRLSRDGVLETLQHLQRLTSYGIAWRSFTEQYLDSTGIFREAVIISPRLLNKSGFGWLSVHGQAWSA